MQLKNIKYLYENDIPYCPTLYEYVNNNFKKYLAILKLAAYRGFKWKDSQYLEAVFHNIYGDIIKERRKRNDFS